MAFWDDNRSAWGAVPSTNPVTVSPSQRTGFMTHWNGPKVGIVQADPHSRCLAFVKSVQKYHVETRGWADIGYNGLVCVHGRSIEGRGVGLQGAHCADYNVNSIGVMVITGEGDVAVPPEALQRQRALYDECCTYASKSLAKLGHRDGAATDCPGDALYSWVKAGMPSPEEDEMSAADVTAILNAIDGVNRKVDTLATAVAQKASATDLKAATTAITALQTKMQEINGNIGIANAEVVGKMEEVAGTINGTIGSSVKDALSGVNIGTNITFPTN